MLKSDKSDWVQTKNEPPLWRLDLKERKLYVLTLVGENQLHNSDGTL